MIFLYILLGIVLLICLILSLRINLHIIYENEPKVYLRILFIKLEILPNTSKIFGFNKQQEKKKDLPTHVLKDIKDADSTSPSIIDKLDSIRNILLILAESFKKHLHVRLSKIHIRVATSDAAKTAILYGAVSTAVACIIDIVDDIANLKTLKESSVSVEPDFLSEKTDIKLNIILYMSVIGTIKVLLHSFIKHYALNDKTQINNRKEN